MQITLGNCAPFPKMEREDALEAVENPFDAVCVAIAQDRVGQRQPLLRGIGDKRFPTEACFEGGDRAVMTRYRGDLIADLLDHPLVALGRASAPAHVVGVTLRLLNVGDHQQTLYPLGFEYLVDGL